MRPFPAQQARGDELVDIGGDGTSQHVEIFVQQAGTVEACVYHDEVSVVATWTVTSSCDDVMHCDGSVTSQQGCTRDLRCRAGQWYTSRRVDDWQPCPDGSTTAGDQSFRFWRTADDPETFAGYDRTIGPSGGCGVNLWLTVEMPFRLTAT